MKLILGSQSTGRQQVLRDAGYTFETMPADIDEKAIRSDNYEELPLLLARAKAEKLRQEIHEPAILITSDTVILCNGELREKPRDAAEAKRFLESYSRYPAQANSAVVVTNTETGRQKEGVDISKAYFKPIPDSVIDEIISQGDVLRAAGGFMIEDPLLLPYVDHVEGDIKGITGLPLELTRKLIEAVQ